MGRQLLQDTVNIRLNVVEDAQGGKIIARGEFAFADKPTSNKRIYTRGLWEREINRLGNAIAERKVFGELDHPADGKTKLSRSAHIVTGLSINESGAVIGSLEVMDTSAGKELKAIMDAGGSIGISSRGYGSVKMNEAGYDEVQEDYQLMTFDCVADPANPTSYPVFTVQGKETESVESGKTTITEQVPVSKDVKMEDKKETQEPKVEAVPVEEKKEVKPEAEKEEPKVEPKEEPEVVSKEDDKKEEKKEEPKEDSKEDSEEDSEEDKKEEAKTISLEDHEKEMSEMKKNFADQLVVALKEVEGRIREEVTGSMKKDPQLAGALESLEKVKDVVKGYLVPEEVQVEINKKSELIIAHESKIKELNLALESAQKEINDLTSVAKDLGFNLYLERKLSKHPKFEDIVQGLGDLTKVESVDNLKTKVKMFEEELAVILSNKEESVKTESSSVVAEVEEIKKKLTEATEKLAKAEEERDQAIKAGLECASKAYLEHKIMGLPEAVEMRERFVKGGYKTKEEVDSLVEEYSVRKRSASTDFEQIKKRLGGRVGARNNTLVEDSLQGTMIEENGKDDFKVTDDFTVPMKTIYKLAGMSSPQK